MSRLVTTKGGYNLWVAGGPPDHLPQLIQYLLIRVRQSARRMRTMRGAEGSAFRGQIVYSRNRPDTCN